MEFHDKSYPEYRFQHSKDLVINTKIMEGNTKAPLISSEESLKIGNTFKKSDTYVPNPNTLPGLDAMLLVKVKQY